MDEIIILSRTDHEILHGTAKCVMCGAKATLSHKGKPYCACCHYKAHKQPESTEVHSLKRVLVMARQNGRSPFRLKYFQFLLFTPPRIKHLIRYSKKLRVRKKNIKRSKKYELF